MTNQYLTYLVFRLDLDPLYNNRHRQRAWSLINVSKLPYVPTQESYPTQPTGTNNVLGLSIVIKPHFSYPFYYLQLVLCVTLCILAPGVLIFYLSQCIVCNPPQYQYQDILKTESLKTRSASLTNLIVRVVFIDLLWSFLRRYQPLQALPRLHEPLCQVVPWQEA